jgi:hypothetical protein
VAATVVITGLLAIQVLGKGTGHGHNTRSRRTKKKQGMTYPTLAGAGNEALLYFSLTNNILEQHRRKDSFWQ